MRKKSCREVKTLEHAYFKLCKTSKEQPIKGLLNLFQINQLHFTVYNVKIIENSIFITYKFKNITFRTIIIVALVHSSIL